MTDFVVDAVAREVLISETAKLRVDAVAREVLISETAKLRVDAVVREVLQTTGIAVPSGKQGVVTIING